MKENDKYARLKRSLPACYGCCLDHKQSITLEITRSKAEHPFQLPERGTRGRGEHGDLSPFRMSVDTVQPMSGPDGASCGRD